MSRTLEYTFAVVALSTQSAFARSGRPPEEARADPAPLAFVRRLVMPKVSVRLSGPEPSGPYAGKGRPAAVRADTGEAEQAALCRRGALRLDEALRDALGRLPGSSVLPERGAFVVGEAETARPPTVGLTPAEAAAARLMASAGSADASLIVVVDRFGVRTAFFREVWLRAVAFVVPIAGPIRRAVFAVGSARTAPRLVRAGFMRDDASMVSDAAADCAGRLARALDRGDQAPFAADTRVAVLPALVPQVAVLTDESGTSIGTFDVPGLARQADVLFHPDSGPVAVEVEPQAVRATMAASGIGAADLWRADTPAADVAARAARGVGADFVFVSRVRAASVGPADEHDGVAVGDLAEVLAVFGLVRVADEQVLWVSRQSGSARSHIVVREGARRIRTREQCVMDAALAAFAYGRFALEEWTRRKKN